MLIMRQPQFEVQDDFGRGSGLIPPIPEWQSSSVPANEEVWYLREDHCDLHIMNVFIRLRNIFHEANTVPLTPSRLHDLTSFVIHRLLSATPGAQITSSTPYSDSIRYAIISYMFIIQGPTYYPHDAMLQDIMNRYIVSLHKLESSFHVYDALDVWLQAIGLVATSGTTNYQWFSTRTETIAISLGLNAWEEVFLHIRRVLWLDFPNGEAMFRAHWKVISE